MGNINPYSLLLIYNNACLKSLELCLEMNMYTIYTFKDMKESIQVMPFTFVRKLLTTIILIYNNYYTCNIISTAENC